MTDMVDRAQQREEEIRADAIARIRNATASSTRPSSNQCMLCGGEIAALRAGLGYATCIVCQQAFEASEQD